jgi:hypothetical protein
MAELLSDFDAVEPAELTDYELAQAERRGFTADDLQEAHAVIVSRGIKPSNMATRLVSAVMLRAERKNYES